MHLANQPPLSENRTSALSGDAEFEETREVSWKRLLKDSSGRFTTRRKWSRSTESVLCFEKTHHRASRTSNIIQNVGTVFVNRKDSPSI